MAVRPCSSVRSTPHRLTDHSEKVCPTAGAIATRTWCPCRATSGRQCCLRGGESPRARCRGRALDRAGLGLLGWKGSKSTGKTSGGMGSPSLWTESTTSCPSAFDANRYCPGAVLERVSDEVRDHLLEASGIPPANDVPSDLAGDAAIRVCGPELVYRRVANALEVGGLWIVRKLSDRRPRVVEEVANHRRHAVRGARHPRDLVALGLCEVR